MRGVRWRSICSNSRCYSTRAVPFFRQPRNEHTQGWQLRDYSTSNGLSNQERPSFNPFNDVRHEVGETVAHQAPNSSASFLHPSNDPDSSVPDIPEESILRRANVHGISTVEQLELEAEFSNVTDQYTQLVRSDNARQDLDLWAVLLDFRNMKDGVDGIRDILKAMLRGGAPVQLHADSVSEHIWRTVLPIVLSDSKLLYELCQIGSSFMRNRPYVFIDVVGQLLAMGNSRLAIIFGSQWLSSHFGGRADILRLFNVSFQLGTTDGLHNFCQLISRLPLHRIYAETVPKLWSAGRKQHALLLHKHLLSLGDYPTDFQQLEPLVIELATRNIKLDPMLRDFDRYGISFSHQARRLYTRENLMTGTTTSVKLGGVLQSPPWARPVKLSDPFVARTFATKSVSFDFVLESLRFIGLVEIGPLAVREMALSATNISELRKRFLKLEEMEIDLGSSNYVRVVKNLCMSSEKNLLQIVLGSDMHHDVFEDAQMQRRLLAQYFGKNQQSEMNRTLAIMASGKTSAEADLNSVQTMLLAALVDGDWRQALTRLDELRGIHESSGQHPNLAPLRFAIQRICNGVNAQLSQDDSYLDAQPYLVGFMQSSLVAGLSPRVWQWRSVLHAIGRSGDWPLFSQLLLCIARICHTTPLTISDDGHPGLVTSTSDLSILVDDSFKSFVIEVGLLADIRNDDPKSPWLLGLELLRTLRRHFNLNLNYESISMAFELRLQELFRGTAFKTRKRLVDMYLKSLKWAWSQSNSSQGGREHAIDEQAASEPRRASLKLFQLHSRLQGNRNMPADVKHMGASAADEFDALPEESLRSDKVTHAKARELIALFGTQSQDRNVNGEDKSTVFYEDFLHPAYNKAVGVQKR